MTYNVVLDTNVLIDITTADRPQHAEARRLVELAEAGRIRVSIVASSLKDAYYVMRRRSEAEMRDFIRYFLTVFTVVPVDGAVCQRAVDSNEPDFEDGIIRAVAEMERMDLIVTRDVAAYAHSTVRAVDAATLVELADPHGGRCANA